MAYCFRCPRCGLRSEAFNRDQRVCGPCLVGPDGAVVVLLRDYGAEGFGIGRGVKVSREGTDRDAADLFLPHARDFAGAGDPDGAKGLNSWNEQHGPREGNKRPKRPEMPLHSKAVL